MSGTEFIRTQEGKDKMVLNGQPIEPGASNVVRAHVGRLPSGTRIFIYAHVYRAEKPGPTVLVVGGLHGDEVNGVQSVRRGMSDGLFDKLTAGTVIAVPILNIYGFINFSREVPDGKDVNRSFPGNMSGSLASRIAGTLTKKILPLVDVGVDFHTGGASRYNYPQIRYTKGDEKARTLAQAFAAPAIIPKTSIPQSLRKVSKKMDLPMLVFEGGESLRLDGISMQKGLNGLERLLFFLGMTKTSQPPNHPVYHISRTSWVRARQAGLFTWTKASGQIVAKNEPIGLIHDPYGTSEHKVLSRKDGFIIGHNNAPVINQGDALFNIGYELEEII